MSPFITRMWSFNTMTWTTSISLNSAQWTLDTGSTLPWLNAPDPPALHPDATARAHEDTDCLPHRP